MHKTYDIYSPALSRISMGPLILGYWWYWWSVKSVAGTWQKTFLETVDRGMITEGGRGAWPLSLARTPFKEVGDRLMLCFRKISPAEYRHKGTTLEAWVPTKVWTKANGIGGDRFENWLRQSFSFSFHCSPWEDKHFISLLSTQRNVKKQYLFLLWMNSNIFHSIKENSRYSPLNSFLMGL